MKFATLCTTHRVKILRRESVADGTIALYLEKPEDFNFIPGQNIDLALEDQDVVDPGDCARTFSIASAPHDDYILVVARIRNNPYKQALKNLPIGSTLNILGPYGTYRLHDDEDIPAAFLIGGIGITPCLSMLFDAARNKSERTFYLFYSNRLKKDIAFLDELENLKKQLPNFNFIPTLTKHDPKSNSWNYETGYINLPMMKKYIDDVSRPIYYLVGPSKMVWEMVQHLDGNVVRDRMKVEDFTGF